MRCQNAFTYPGIAKRSVFKTCQLLDHVLVIHINDTVYFYTINTLLHIVL